MTFRGAALSFLVTTVVAVATVAAIADSPQYGESANGVVGGGGGRYNTYDYSQQQQQQQQPQSNYGEPVPRSYEGYSPQQEQQRQPQQGQYGYDDAGSKQVLEIEPKAVAKEEENGFQNGSPEEEQLPPLPDGWSEFMDPASGRPYYYHAEKRITTWERPLPPPVEPVADESTMENASVQTDTGGAESVGLDVPQEQAMEQEQRMGNSMGEYGAVDQQKQQPLGEQSDSGIKVSTTPEAVDSSAPLLSTETDASAAGSDPVRDTNTPLEEERRQPFGENDLKSQQQGWGLPQQTKEPAQSGYYSNESQSNNSNGMENQQWKSPTSSTERPLEGQAAPHQNVSSNTAAVEKEQQQSPPQNINPQQGQDRIEQKKPSGYFGDNQQQQQQDPRRQEPPPQQYQSPDFYGRPPQQPRTPYYGNPPQQGNVKKPYSSPSEPPAQQQRQQQQQQPPNKYPFVPQQQRSGDFPPQPDKPAPITASPPGKLRQLWGKVSSSDTDVKPIAPAAAVNQGAPPPHLSASSGIGGGTRMPPPGPTSGAGYNAGTGFDSGARQNLPDRSKGGPTGGLLPPQQQQLQPPTGGMNQQGGRPYVPPSMPQQQQQRHQQPPQQPQYNGMYGQHQYQQPGSGGPGYGLYGAGPDANNKQSVEPTSTLKDSLGSAWTGVLGFGTKTKAAVEQAADTVVQRASGVTENVSTKGLGAWDKFKGSLFDGSPDQKGPNEYSLSPYGGQPPMSGQPPQQQQQQQYPPQNYGGYPPGPGYPGPRQIQPYPHQRGPQQPGAPGARPQGPPMQSQWDGQQNRWQGSPGPNSGPGPGANAGPGPGPQGQFSGSAPGQGGPPGPEGGGRRPPPQGQQPPPQGQSGWNRF